MKGLLRSVAAAASRVIHGRHDSTGPASKASPYVDMEPQFLRIWERCQPFTMTSIERGYGLFKAVEYVTRVSVPGDLVECGVWRGGSSMLMAMALCHFGDTARVIHLFDTFAGMTRPSDDDLSSLSGQPLLDRWSSSQRQDGGNNWAYASIDEVRRNLSLTDYPAERLAFHLGDVAETVPAAAVGDIAVLRLDTDFYASTRIELEVLFPRVAPGGFVISDDYGHFTGAKAAVDEYFETLPVVPFLHRLDYTGRLIQIGRDVSRGPTR